ncbi:vesicular glutamate transporter 1 isoform X1 [Phalacrocorax aristotelis]|uniref:vesicular glutamate transporter 1 isoform X1 n=1 Tax=Phalacrocorax aristotelis TaxID=126867 RepID=UPI003F4C51FC
MGSGASGPHPWREAAWRPRPSAAPTRGRWWPCPWPASWCNTRDGAPSSMSMAALGCAGTCSGCWCPTRARPSTPPSPPRSASTSRRASGRASAATPCCWTFYLLLISQPAYFEEVFGFEISKVGPCPRPGGTPESGGWGVCGTRGSGCPTADGPAGGAALGPAPPGDDDRRPHRGPNRRFPALPGADVDHQRPQDDELRRVRYGGDAAAGGGVLAVPCCRHLLPRPGCRLQRLCHLRVQCQPPGHRPPLRQRADGALQRGGDALGDGLSPHCGGPHPAQDAGGVAVGVPHRGARALRGRGLLWRLCFGGATAVGGAAARGGGASGAQGRGQRRRGGGGGGGGRGGRGGTAGWAPPGIWGYRHHPHPWPPRGDLWVSPPLPTPYTGDPPGTPPNPKPPPCPTPPAAPRTPHGRPPSPSSLYIYKYREGLRPLDRPPSPCELQAWPAGGTGRHWGTGGVVGYVLGGTGGCWKGSWGY